MQKFMKFCGFYRVSNSKKAAPVKGSLRELW